MRYVFWYLPMYIMYAKILAHMHDHIHQFYENCWSLDRSPFVSINGFSSDYKTTKCWCFTGCSSRSLVFISFHCDLDIAIKNSDIYYSFCRWYLALSKPQGLIQKKSVSGSQTLPFVIFDKKCSFSQKIKPLHPS